MIPCTAKNREFGGSHSSFNDFSFVVRPYCRCLAPNLTYQKCFGLGHVVTNLPISLTITKREKTVNVCLSAHMTTACYCVSIFVSCHLSLLPYYPRSASSSGKVGSTWRTFFLNWNSLHPSRRHPQNSYNF